MYATCISRGWKIPAPRYKLFFSPLLLLLLLLLPGEVKLRSFEIQIKKEELTMHGGSRVIEKKHATSACTLQTHGCICILLMACVSLLHFFSYVLNYEFQKRWCTSTSFFPHTPRKRHKKCVFPKGINKILRGRNWEKKTWGQTRRNLRKNDGYAFFLFMNFLMVWFLIVGSWILKAYWFTINKEILEQYHAYVLCCKR